MPSKLPDLGLSAAGAARADPLDLWLRRGLHQLYSAVAAEPIPLELLRLVEEHSNQSQRRGRDPPSPGDWDASATKEECGFEQRVRERAYFLWLEEDCPAGRAVEHWMRAFTEQVAEEAYKRYMA
jgi:Protein of unknown function (DUF2934)